MTTTYESMDAETGKPLALHIRRLRQWFGSDGMSQADLATLAGISPRLLRSYEAARILPKTVEALLSIAFVLKVPFERLVAPGHLERIQAGIENRTGDLELTVLGAARDNGSEQYAP